MTRNRLIAKALVIVALIATSPSVQATSSRTLEATFSSGISNGWVRVERWRDNSSSFFNDTFPSDGRGDQNGQRATFFGTTEPASNKFLLYYAPHWSSGTKATPVLLVHGANQDADFAWANPDQFGANACGYSTCPTTGLMQYLDGRGYKVFAISFPGFNGDGYNWSEEIYDAIQIVKSDTAASQVDVVSWSKGAFNARQYVSSVKHSWGSSYAGDVRRLILIGNPNNGFDYEWRHGINPSVGVYPECGVSANGAAPHDDLVCYGVWYSHPELDFGSSSYAGTKQMLKRWDGTYSLGTTEQDWYTTYYGGWGYYSHSPGITTYTGSSLVDTIRSAGVPSSIKTYLICGGANDIPNIENEYTGPSDGLIFIASCQSTTGIATVGGNVLYSSLNHLRLGWDTSAESQVDSWLSS
ncbi:MAG: esterase/lipase family protein [Actinomycetota bacterium]